MTTFRKPTAGKRAKAKFKIGQTVALTLADGRGYAFGEFMGTSDSDGRKRLRIRFWDFDRSDWWEWDWETKFVRCLTAQERGSK